MPPFYGFRDGPWLTYLLLNGPNLNLLGVREPGVYGHVSLEQIHERMTQLAAEAGHRLSTFQSNSEAELIARIHQAPTGHVAFIIFNPAGFTHTSIALRDALLAVKHSFHRGAPLQRPRPGELPPPLVFLRHRRRLHHRPGPIGYELALRAAAHHLGASAKRN